MNTISTTRSRNLPIAATVLLLLFLAGCDSSPGETKELSGGVLATFDVEAEQYKIWITNEAAIQQLFELQGGLTTATIPNGKLRRGAGPGNHNDPWSWHIDPEDIDFAEVTITVCSGLPSYVEEDMQEWIDNVGHFCPWSAVLAELEDLR